MSFNFSIDKKNVSNLYRKMNALKDKYKEKKTVFAGWDNSEQGSRGLGYASIAWVNEYGGPIMVFGKTPGFVPARPFIRPTVIYNKSLWFASLKTKLLSSDSYETILNRLADKIKEDLKQSVIAVSNPALSKNTVKLRKNGSEKPLIETGGFINAIKSEVS